MRSATPATILVLAACILLVLVTCSTPVIKSLSFLEATIGGNGTESGQKATLGCLGYCIQGTCKGPTIGYSFNPTQLLGIATNVDGYQVDSSKYSTAVIKGLTYCLVLNPIALAACVITLLTGLLAHCGDMSLVCINGLFSGLASTLTLVAVALNFALFVLAKKRIDSINGASASYGVALWLALAAWILIVLSSCAFCCSCGGRGGGGGGRNKRNKMQDEDTWRAPQNTGGGGYGANNGYADQMRMDAIQAESDRKRRQKDLPKFATYETEHVEELPLKQDYEDYTPHGQGRHGGLPPGAGYHGAGQYQQDYGYAYGDDGSYAMHNAAGTGAGSNAYIAGVGTGALRGSQPQTAASRYYDSSVPNSSNNLAGYGAHDLSSPATTVPPHVNGYGSAAGTPMGMPEPVHANSARGDGNMDYFYNANPAANHPTNESEGLQSHDVYGGYTNDARSQQNHQYEQSGTYMNDARSPQSHQYEQSGAYPYEPSYQSHQDMAPASGHGTDVEGGTFGPQSRSTKHSQYAHSQHDQSYGAGANGTRSRTQSQSRQNAPAESSQSPYDAVQQATAAGRSRRLPAIPTGAAINSNPQQSAGEIPYSPTSPSQQQPMQMNEGFGVSSVPSPRQTTGDDGFGLAVLKAGAAAAASSSHHHSDLPPPGYSEEQPSSTYHNPYAYPSEKR
ncbi:pali-domain-containing protein [Meira miltonrushii]|uniref:Pali-domain-containing protein n=1 Tax=Meira miltonrushii TaxID=1280837 RepID=A0A316VAQ7_9BASI|nr:pali-domain-containing protein [Meira miltonrushii]PWN32615.1 pali-domain-containing protein [Meira miltonrushii]